MPSCEYTSLLLKYTETIVSMSGRDNISYAQSYLNLITDNARLNDYLQSCKDSFKWKESCNLCLPVQNKNSDLESNQLCLPVHNQNSEPESICKQKQLISCLLCSKKHKTYKCPQLYKLRDSIIDRPDELCSTHCGRKTTKCLEKECHLYPNRNGKFSIWLAKEETHMVNYIFYYVLSRYVPPEVIKYFFLKERIVLG